MDVAEADVSARVRAVVLEQGGRPASGGLGGQTRPPEEVLVVGPDGVRAALDADADWLWLLDGSVAPREDALARLLETLDSFEDLPSPDLLVSKIVRSDGSLDPGSLPVAQVRDPDLAVAAFERHLLSLRVARRGSLLVRTSAVVAIAARWPHLDPFMDDLEWTARLLKSRTGLLVPGSSATRLSRSTTRRAVRELPRRTRLLLGDSLELGDKPWFAFRFAEEALADLRSR